MKVYVGSSWKNENFLDFFHSHLNALGIETWDFRKQAFWREDVAAEWLEDSYKFIEAPESIKAFEYDKQGLDSCDAGLFILPCGISTALEAGYMSGQRKKVAIYGPPREPRLDIMWRFAGLRINPNRSVKEATRQFSEWIKT